MIEHLIPILAGTLGAAVPLIFAGLGELVTERTGVINLGVEGMMLVGAIAGFAAAAETGYGAAAGIPAGALAGAGIALVFAFFALSLAANQAACGLALTIFGIGLSAFIGQHYVSYSLPGLKPIALPLLSDIPVIGPILFTQDAVVYLSLLAFAGIAWTLGKTRLGLLLKAIGESPEAAHAIGYPVISIRFGAVAFGGAMAGIAGAYLSTVYTPLWVQNMSAGRGWIAVALVVFASWKPARLMLGAYLFGAITILQFHAQGLGLIVPVQFLAALPYAATIVVLVIISRDRRVLQNNLPASLGKPFLPDLQNSRMSTLLLKNADVLVTMDAGRREIPDGGVFIRDGVIEQVGRSDTLPPTADQVVSLQGCVALPGLVNTHHHMYQSLTRAIPGAQDAELFAWLRRLYPIWAGITPEMIRVSTLTAMAELILSGCTTSSDHLYLYPNGSRLDDSIEAAATIGMRFHAARGSMSVGESAGGLPPDRLVEDENAILKDTQRLIETWHNPARHAMQRIVVAPCSPFSVSRELMREAAALARNYRVSLHTHLAENDNDIAYSREKFGMTPAEYAESLGWVGPDVWHAHCVKLDAAGIALFARTGTGVAHCPCSNMRLASGIAPIPAMREAGVPVGIAVDGSASSDSGHLFAEVRQSLLLARVGFGPAAMSARQALEIATLGGAKVLGRDDIGALAPGMSADIVAFGTDSLDLSGAAVHDPVAALLFCTPQNVRHSIINGKRIVSDGQLLPLELPALIAQHNRLARQLINGG